MLRRFVRLLGDDAPVFRRYIAMAVAHGVLCGLTITALVPVLSHLLMGEVQQALRWLAALLSGVVACWVVRRRVERAGVRVGVGILQGGRHRLGVHLAALPVGWFTPRNAARLGHVATQGMMGMAQLPGHVFTPVITGVVTPVVFAAALSLLHGPLGLVAWAALPVLAGALALTNGMSRRADEAFHGHFAAASQRMVEFAQAQSVLRAFSGEGGGVRLLEEDMAQQRRSGQRLIWLSALSAVFNGWMVQAVFAVLLVTAAWGWVAAPEGAGDAAPAIAIIVSLLLVSRYIDALLEVASYGEVLRGARGRLAEIDEVFAAEPLPEPDNPRAPCDASIDLRDVRFRYAPGGPEVLRGVDLHIAPGRMTALVGESGSGKTTLVRLIARFFDASQGSVQVGGVDVRHMASAQLAGHISQIFQDTYLFAGTIAENVRVGKRDASDAEVMDAVRLAGAADLVARLPQGLGTPVGEGGARLSGGERQRICIARALIKDAPILLVDEATSALDAESQAVIADALARLRGQRTVVVIAHQLSTVAQADQVAVLSQGRIVEQGTPAQLRAHEGHFARFLRQREAAKGWRIATFDAPRGEGA